MTFTFISFYTFILTGFLRPRCSVSQLPLPSEVGLEKEPLVLLPMELRSVPLTSLCNEGYSLRHAECDWSLKVQADGEGLPPLTMSRWELMSLVWCSALLRCLEVAALDPQACCGEKEILETR